VENSYIKKYSQSLYPKIINPKMKNKEVFEGKDILEYTNTNQINLFILKRIFDNWKRNHQLNKSPFFNYDNEELKSQLEKYMIILSKNILLNIKQIKSLTVNSIEDFILISLKPYKFFRDEFKKIDNQINIKRLLERKKYYVINQEIFIRLINLIKQLNKTWVKRIEILNVINKIENEKIQLKDYEEKLIKLLEIDHAKINHLTNSLNEQDLDTPNKYNDSYNIKLFRNNKEEMNIAIEIAKSKENFDVAVEYLLKNYREKNGWKMNDPNLKNFLKLIYKFYK